MRQSIPPEETADRSWLILVYRIQPNPVRLRTAVWRRLRRLGAVYLQSGTAALPYSSASERALRKLHSDIEGMSGYSILFRCDALAGAAGPIGAFNAARADEYGEVVSKCRTFLDQMEREHESGHFTFAELEENEVDLVKLQKWLSKICARDAFGAPGP